MHFEARSQVVYKEACAKMATRKAALIPLLIAEWAVIILKDMKWLEPWHPIENELGLVEELALELSAGHGLYGKKVKVIARRKDKDDVLFELSDELPQVVVVHLTWSHKSEKAPWPKSERFRSLDEFAKNRMAADVNEYYPLSDEESLQEKFGAMTVNERLSETNQIAQYDAALRAKDKPALRRILESIFVDEPSIGKILEKV